MSDIKSVANYIWASSLNDTIVSVVGGKSPYQHIQWQFCKLVIINSVSKDLLDKQDAEDLGRMIAYTDRIIDIALSSARLDKNCGFFFCSKYPSISCKFDVSTCFLSVQTDIGAITINFRLDQNLNTEILEKTDIHDIGIKLFNDIKVLIIQKKQDAQNAFAEPYDDSEDGPFGDDPWNESDDDNFKEPDPEPDLDYYGDDDDDDDYDDYHDNFYDPFA